MRTTVFLLSVLAAFVSSALEISKVPEGKLCAFSLTYDDGAATHYTHALPLHEKYGIPGTFFIVTDRVEADAADRAHRYCSWTELKEMSRKGLEIASHTKSHRNMREIESAGLTKEMTKGKKRDELFRMREPNWPALLAEVVDSKKEIEEHCGNAVTSYAFAGNAYPDWTGRLMGEVKGCTRFGIALATGRGDTTVRYEKVLDEKVMVSNKVSCAMIHGVGTKTKSDGWNPPDSFEVFESLFPLLKAREDRIHLDTFGRNAAYAKRAEKAVLGKDRENPGVFVLTLREDDRRFTQTGEIWLRVAADEKVSVNGKPAVPNRYGAVLAHIGDRITVK